MNRYAIEPRTSADLELVALHDDEPPYSAFRVNGSTAERFYRTRDLWEQAQLELRMILLGQAPSTDGEREDRR